ncbi:hypothetical protein ONZ45_g10413 [Pleurotus djamor]|nr:hypothetical protein ONZ45_g10413 [Pleurotus djamor]
MISGSLGTLPDDARIKASEGLVILETLLITSLRETSTSSSEKSPITWQKLSTRLSCLQNAVSVFIRLEDALLAEARVKSYDGQISDEDWADVEAEEEELEDLSDAEVPQRMSTEESLDIDATALATFQTTSVIASSNQTLDSKYAQDASLSTPDEDIKSSDAQSFNSPLATAPLDPVQLSESSFRRLSHQLSELSSTLIVEWNQTRRDLAAECIRRRDLELERNIASLKTTELEEKLQQAQREREGLTREKEDILLQLQKACLREDAITSEKVALETQLQLAISQTSALTKERDDLRTRLAQATSTIDATITERDELSKHLNAVVAHNDALIVDNKVFLDRVQKAYIQRDAAQKLVDDLTSQVQELTTKNDSLAKEKHEARERLRKANTQLEARAAEATSAQESLLKEKAAFKTELDRLKREVAFLKSEIVSSQPWCLKAWDSWINLWLLNKSYTPTSESMPWIDFQFKRIESYSLNFPVTYESLKTTTILNTLHHARRFSPPTTQWSGTHNQRALAFFDNIAPGEFLDSLSALEALITPNPSYPDASTVGNTRAMASLKWKASSTRIGALQGTVDAPIELDDQMIVDTQVVGFQGQSSNEEWSILDGEVEILEAGVTRNAGKVVQQVPSEISSQATHAGPPFRTPPTHRIAAVQRAILDDVSTEDAPATSRQHNAKASFNWSNSPSVIFLSDLNNTLVIEWTRTKSDFTAESQRNRELELERDVAVFDKEGFEERLQEAATQKDAVIMERNSLQVLLQQVAAQRNALSDEKAQISSRLREVESERDVVARGKEHLAREKKKLGLRNDAVVRENSALAKRLQHAKSQVFNLTQEKGYFMKRYQKRKWQEDELSKCLQSMTSRKEASEKENNLLRKRIRKAYVVRDSAVRRADDLAVQVHALIQETDAMTEKMEETSRRLRETNSKLAILTRKKKEFDRRLSKPQSQQVASTDASTFATQLRRTQEAFLKQIASLKHDYQALKKVNDSLMEENALNQSTQIKYWRDKLARMFLSPTHTPKHKEMPAMHDLFEEIEWHRFPVAFETLTSSGILKTMRSISTLHKEDVPRDSEFKFRERAKALVDKWEAARDLEA